MDTRQPVVHRSLGESFVHAFWPENHRWGIIRIPRLGRHHARRPIWRRHPKAGWRRGNDSLRSAGKCKPAITGPVEYVQWSNNGHWYRAELPGSGGISWKDARAAAESAGGYLATITSEAENAFVFAVARFTSDLWFIDSAGNGIGPWLGGFQPEGSSEPAGGWTWVTGERMGYTNWVSGEPNNSGGAENALHFYGKGALIDSTWNDVGGSAPVRGYLVDGASPDVCRRHNPVHEFRLSRRHQSGL